MKKHEDGECLHQRITHVSPKLLCRVKSTESLKNSLSVGSKRILDRYQKDLCVSRGIENPLFDKDMKLLLYKYVYDKKSFDNELDYLNHLKDDNGYLFSRDLKLYSMCEEAMLRFSDPDYTSFRWNINYQQALEEFRNELRGLNLRPLRYSSDDDVAQIFQKVDSHSGFNYILTGVKKKGENIEGILGELIKKEEEAILKGSFDIPILLGFRTQASGEYEDTGDRTYKCKHKLRVISMMDLYFIASESRFIKPLHDVLCHKEWYAGGKDDYELSSQISHWRTRYNYFMSIDYSSFDQTLPGWFIEDVCDCIKCAFNMTEKEEALWNVIKHDYVFKTFILAEGLLFSKKGLSSGIRGTQPIGSACDYLAVKTFFIANKSYCSMMAMSDDNIIFTKEKVELDLLASYLRKNFGLIINTDDKSNTGSCLKDPKFLSRYWTKGGPYRHPNQLISRLLFPERFRDYRKENVSPELVLFAYILTYPRGMTELLDVRRFKQDNPNLSRDLIWNRVDGRYLTGIMAYVRDYQTKLKYVS